MIPKETIDRIFAAAQIEEVISEYVHLKKRGANYVGLCPFHNEKTPSFTVTPSMGIYKCFGCGEGGNVVNFLIKHEQLSYPEALKLLANKYQIEIEEETPGPEQEKQRNERESLYIITHFAKTCFKKFLTENPEGKSIGMSYLRERGITDEMIKKFEIGFCPDSWDLFTKNALNEGYKEEFLISTGLSKQRDGGALYDGFRGRIIFPVHNLSGRIIGFGGRIIKSNTNAPKYVNTTECAIYHKSDVLYGLYFARKEIMARENCYLVEGYTDVITLHQAGIANAVASSGTSLTENQIRLIKRYTPNITMLYDGDTAGINASIRGIDMILAQGMHVRIVLFPKGEDPDSYARKVKAEDLIKFINENAQDFISFKTALLLQEAKKDPIKKSALLHEVIQTISVIPDHITREVYIRECSKKLQISEQALYSEMDKLRRKWRIKQAGKKEQQQSGAFPVAAKHNHHAYQEPESSEPQEKEIIRLLLKYGNEMISIETKDQEGKKSCSDYSISEFITRELTLDKLRFSNPVYNKIFGIFCQAMQNKQPCLPRDFIMHEDKDIRKTAIDLLSEKYVLHKWASHQIEVPSEKDKLKRHVLGSIYSIKLKYVLKLIADNQKLIREAQEKGGDVAPLLKWQKKLDHLKSEISVLQSRVILK